MFPHFRCVIIIIAIITSLSSCARGDTICARPRQTTIPQFTPNLHPEFAKTNKQTNNNNNRKKISTVLFYQVCADTVEAKQRAQQNYMHRLCLLAIKKVDLWTNDLESGVRVTCNVGYLYANFSIPMPLYSRVRPDVRNRQTSDRHTDKHTSDKSIT